MSAVEKAQKHIMLDANGTAVARHGLILSQNGATGSRKVSRYLPGLRDVLKTSKIAANVHNLEKTKILKTKKSKLLIPGFPLLAHVGAGGRGRSP